MSPRVVVALLLLGVLVLVVAALAVALIDLRLRRTGVRGKELAREIGSSAV